MKRETKTAESHCLYCNKLFDRCTSVEDEKAPKPGDLTCCIRCGCVMAFDKDMRVRAITEEELQELQSDPRIKEILQRTVTAIRAVNARMPQN